MSGRRGRGEGSIARRTDGRWMARIDLGWQNGKRRSKAIYGRSRREVVDALRGALKAAEDGTLSTDQRQTVGDFLKRWLQDVARPRVRPRTFVGYDASIDRHISPHLGRLRLTKLTPQHLQAWMATLETLGVTAGRRRYARVVLRTALNTAIRWRLITTNVATLIDAPRITTREIQPLNPDEARALLDACHETSLDAFVTVALGCGLRLGEALGLQWIDVDLDTATLQVRRAIQRFGGDAAARRPLLAERKRLRAALKVTPVTPEAAETRIKLAEELQTVRSAFAAVKTSVQITDLKSVRSRRTIALPAVVIAALRSHRTRQLEARLAAGRHWQDRGFVLTSGVGTPLEPRNVTRQFKALLRAANIRNMRLHDLRHSCATLLLAQGVNPRVVMETLGHSQVSLTLNTYSHVLPALQHDAAARMNAVLER
jgi:integrase